ncbi:MAG: phage holin family protein [Beutenbergiaceae bacterium]
MTDLPSRPGSEPSLGQLVGKMTETVSSLVRDEIQLAQAQLAEKGKAVGTGAAMFAVAGVLGLFGLGWLLHTAFLAISLALPSWAAALIVAVMVLAIAAAAALIGKKMIDNAPNPQTKENLQRDLDAIKAGVST